eukprot:238941_1
MASSLLLIATLTFRTQSRIGLVIPNNFESYALVCPPQSPFPCAATDNEFTQTNQFDLANHRFYEGFFGCNAANIAITTSGLATINAALTTQLLIDTYSKTDDPIDIILTYGIAGGMDDRLNIGDVVIPSRWAIYNLWYWQNANEGPNDALPLEEFGDSDREFGFWNTTEYQRVWFQPQELFLEPEVRSRTHFFEVDEELLNVMKSIEEQIENDLIQCIPNDETQCLSHKPLVYTSIEDKDVIGLTGDIFVDNAAWRTTLFEFYNAQSIDMETGAVAMVAATNEIPFIAFRSVSDLAGGDGGDDIAIFLSLAVENSITVLIDFIHAVYCQNGDTATNTGGHDDDDDDDIDSDSNDMSVAAQSIGDNLQDNTEENNGHKIVISFSKNAMNVIWALVIGLAMVNVIIIYCYWCKSTKNTKDVFDSKM